MVLAVLVSTVLARAAGRMSTGTRRHDGCAPESQADGSFSLYDPFRSAFVRSSPFDVLRSFVNLPANCRERCPALPTGASFFAPPASDRWR